MFTASSDERVFLFAAAPGPVGSGAYSASSPTIEKGKEQILHF
jgi:hypothetical protein